MKIAQSRLFTPHEKFQLLSQLKAGVIAAQLEGNAVAFDGAEIDAAIALVRQAVADGVNSQIIHEGDF